MKTKSKWILITAALVIASLNLSAQKPADLVGTWVGGATLEGEPPNNLTLVLTLSEGKLSGHMTDEYGSLFEAAAKDILLEKGVFSFTVTIQTENGDVDVQFKMNVEGTSMSGDLLIPSMEMSGKWEAKKQ